MYTWQWQLFPDIFTKIHVVDWLSWNLCALGDWRPPYKNTLTPCSRQNQHSGHASLWAWNSLSTMQCVVFMCAVTCPRKILWIGRLILRVYLNYAKCILCVKSVVKCLVKVTGHCEVCLHIFFFFLPTLTHVSWTVCGVLIFQNRNNTLPVASCLNVCWR